jgi:hypothetical protein
MVLLDLLSAVDLLWSVTNPFDVVLPLVESVVIATAITTKEAKKNIYPNHGAKKDSSLSQARREKPLSGIGAHRQKPGYPHAGDGKWLLHALHPNIDNLWRIVMLATEEGYLGSYSKVSTTSLPFTIKTSIHIIWSIPMIAVIVKTFCVFERHYVNWALSRGFRMPSSLIRNRSISTTNSTKQ